MQPSDTEQRSVSHSEYCGSNDKDINSADLIPSIRSLPVVHRVEVLIRTTPPLITGEDFKIL